MARAERWRPIDGFGGYYQVSDQGRVKSAPRLSTRGGILKQPVGSTGYLIVHLYDHGTRVRMKVHLLVAAAFLGPRPARMETRHLDGDKLNNRLANLAYGTSSDNKLDTVRAGRHRNARKTHCPAGHPYDEANTIRRGGFRYCRACSAARKPARKRAAA